MSNSRAYDSSHHRQPTEEAGLQAGSSPQFAHGGNGSTGMVQSTDALSSAGGPSPSTADRLVMLQLASFEGRAF